MMISIPRPTAPDAYSATTAGVRWADITRLSCATPNFASISPAAFIASQSDLLPMMIPTSGFSFDMTQIIVREVREVQGVQEVQGVREVHEVQRGSRRSRSTMKT